MVRLDGWLADAVDESTDDESAADPNAKGAAMQADEVRTNERRVGFDFMFVLWQRNQIFERVWFLVRKRD